MRKREADLRGKVWERCDGKQEPAAVAARLHEELGLPAAVDLVWQAVARLQKARLLQETIVPESVSRRALVKQLALAAGLAALLPVVESLGAPPAAAAVSGAPVDTCKNVVCPSGELCLDCGDGPDCVPVRLGQVPFCFPDF